MGFPPANAIPITNEAGEPIGWDVQSDDDRYFHDECGLYHIDGRCPNDEPDPEDEDEYDEYDEYDPGPEVDDQGGMSEVSLFPVRDDYEGE
jgi:hypothetical protein